MVQVTFQPLEVEGLPLFSASSTCADSKRMLRLSLYRQTEGYVFSASFTSTLERETARHALGRAKSKEDLADELRNLHPEKWVRGYPSGIQFRAKQKALLREIVNRWETLVGNALAQVKD